MSKEKKEEEKKQNKTCKEKFFCQPRPFLSFWDGVMLVIIAYSCFSSAYFASFEFNICDKQIFWIENVCTVFFFIDIFFNFVRIPEDKVNQKVTHIDLFKMYNRNLRFPLDLAATIPFYLYTFSQI